MPPFRHGGWRRPWRGGGFPVAYGPAGAWDAVGGWPVGFPLYSYALAPAQPQAPVEPGFAEARRAATNELCAPCFQHYEVADWRGGQPLLRARAGLPTVAKSTHLPSLEACTVCFRASGVAGLGAAGASSASTDAELKRSNTMPRSATLVRLPAIVVQPGIDNNYAWRNVATPGGTRWAGTAPWAVQAQRWAHRGQGMAGLGAMGYSDFGKQVAPALGAAAVGAAAAKYMIGGDAKSGAIVGVAAFLGAMLVGKLASGDTTVVIEGAGA